MRSIVAALIVILAGLLLAGCGSSPPPPAANPYTAYPAAGTDPAGTGLGSSYRLGTGDRLRLIVFGEEELTGEFQVDGTGQVAFPLIGSMPAAGQTVRDLEQRVTQALRNGLINNPRVSIEVLGFRPFYILGEVNEPGEYPYVDGLTVLNAVATARGYTPRANKGIVLIRRAGSQEEERIRVQPGTLVQPGDTLRIPERFF